MNEIVQAIGQFINDVGFPIAMVVIMGYLLYKEQKNHREAMDSLKDALNNNTTVMTKLEVMIQDLKDAFIGRNSKDEDGE